MTRTDQKLLTPSHTIDNHAVTPARDAAEPAPTMTVVTVDQAFPNADQGVLPKLLPTPEIDTADGTPGTASANPGHDPYVQDDPHRQDDPQDEAYQQECLQHMRQMAHIIVNAASRALAKERREQSVEAAPTVVSTPQAETSAPAPSKSKLKPPVPAATPAAAPSEATGRKPKRSRDDRLADASPLLYPGVAMQALPLVPGRMQPTS